MDIYVHNRLCSAEEVEDIQISRIHKIRIIRYQEAADDKHRLKLSDLGSHSGHRKGGGNAIRRLRRKVGKCCSYNRLADTNEKIF